MKMLRGIKSTLGAAIALCLICTTLVTAGCTPAQQQTTVQVVTKINAYLPSVQNAADTVAATLAVLLPADQIIINVSDTAFDAMAQTLQALTTSYLKNPSASVLAQIQTAINTLESTVNTATLNATGIKDPNSQKLALAALKGLLTLASVLFALISPLESASQLQQLRETDTIHLARSRVFMDQRVLEDAVADQGVPFGLRGAAVNRAFDQAAAAGF